MTVIFIGALVMSLGIAVAFIGQTAVITAGQLDNRDRALQVASACLDEAAYRLKLSSSYTGGTVPVGSTDTCTVTVSGSGSTRTVSATASSGVFTRTISLTATLKQNIATNASGWALGAWTEVDP